MFKPVRRSLPLYARDIMSTPAITAHEKTPLRELSKIMCDNRVGSVIIVGDDEKIRGIVTERDIICAAGKAEATLDMPAWGFMTPDPVTVTPETPLTDVIEKMTDLGVRHMPVVDKDGKPLGMISARDIVAAMELFSKMFRGK
ncbi:MAG: CBS domain-containing protein [Desulfurococcales archaeon]|nr:CBS domain-containing protein [Desulfurococcales archaeon]